MRVRDSLRGGLAFGDKEYEARKILSIVLHGFGENHSTVMVGSALSGDGGERFVLACKNFTHAARGIFRRHAFP